VEVLAVGLFVASGSLLFLVIPPLLFSYVEGWSYGEGFYYAFITLSTIGFGDYVVGEEKTTTLFIRIFPAKVQHVVCVPSSMVCLKLGYMCP